MLYILTFGSGFVLSLLLTPLVRTVALKLGIVDIPNHERWHKNPTPVLGGMAIFLAFTIVVILVKISPLLPWISALGNPHFLPAGALRTPQFLGLLIGSALIFLLGVADDIEGTYPKLKLAGQICAAAIVAAFGVRMEIAHSLWIDVPLTLFWIVGITNAFNLLDNMDGLSAGIAAIGSLGFSFFFLGTGEVGLALLTLALAGGALGFLRYNFNSARIFMGDCGAMFLGFTLSAIALLGCWQDGSGLCFASLMPLFVLGVPIFDTALVSIDRMVHGRSIAHGGKDHSSHRLVALGLGPKGAVLALYGISIVLLVAAYPVCYASLKACVSVLGIVVGALVVFGLRLGRVEVYGREYRKRPVYGAGDSLREIREFRISKRSST